MKLSLPIIGWSLAAAATYAALGVEIAKHSSRPVPSTDTLCIYNHPAPRIADVTYADLPPRHGYQRDHLIPLCLGGADDSSNVRYQPLDQAHIKDTEERRYCEAYCRGTITLDAARLHFLHAWGQKR